MTLPPQRSFKANVLANYVGQFYVAGVNILLLPWQVRMLGSEAYGLVGFFAMLSGWLQLLDLGLSPTLSRETAKFRAGALDGVSYRQLFWMIEILFLSLGGAAALLVAMLSGPISRHWLQGKTLEPSTVANAVALMGLVFAFRWQASLSRSVLVGLERQVWVNLLNAAFATFRSVGVLGILRWVSPTPRAFFLYQAAISCVELVLLRWVVSRSLGARGFIRRSWNLEPLRRVAGFSLTVAITSSIWVSVTQLDNLMLSKLLPLSEYAWFSIAVMAASGINLVAGPIGQAVQPRLTYMFATATNGEFRATYSDATQLLSATALTASLVVAVAARPLLWVWTGNSELAQRTAPVLAFYALGNGLLAVVAMTYYLQVASGDLKLHLKGNFAFAALQLPLVAIATLRAGMLGASFAWFAANLGFFLIWSAIVHRRFLPGIHTRWYLFDVGLPCLAGLTPTLALLLVDWHAASRLRAGLALATTALSSTGLACLVSSPGRRVLGALKSRFAV